MVSGLMPIAAPIDLAAPSPLRRAISSSTRIPLSSMRSVPPERELVGAVFRFLGGFRLGVRISLWPVSLGGDPFRSLHGHSSAVMLIPADRLACGIVSTNASSEG